MIRLLIRAAAGLLVLYIIVPQSFAQDTEVSVGAKPIAAPDRWADENGNLTFDAGEFYDPLVTGYGAKDVGSQFMLEVSGDLSPGIDRYVWVRFPAIGDLDNETKNGSQSFRDWLTDGSLIRVGDHLALESGVMAQATREVLADIIAKDPAATWDVNTESIANSAFGVSPRLLHIPFFNPSIPPAADDKSVHITRVMVLFLESVGAAAEIQARLVDTEPFVFTPVLPATWGKIKALYSP